MILSFHASFLLTSIFNEMLEFDHCSIKAKIGCHEAGGKIVDHELCQLHIFQKTAESGNGLAHVVKTEWGVDMNSAICKNRWEIETNATFL